MSAPDFPLTPAMLTAIIQVMRIDSERMQQALHDHLVLGHAQTVAAARYGYERQQLNVHVKRIREKLKPAFDAYADAVLHP